ncbi:MULTISPECIES: methyltransferase domain-containing protein [unclassified Ruegeria]|uniref:methyltransferase domain-containing protein n=1 Tax=unclassified Ruegeria TaxID=2625375 RepID=UPI00148A092E|nr:MULTISPECIES: methyltransferase domain-containing protein [unclassified Ruegeria]NOD35410.1 methyltransferase domain-containing protein [Ruegeria sp. HKCCD7296]NOE32249.1 methyltransferase domain-containing protein [Ruegeria sp. HKCCD7318]NOE42825.1 methyltransferase domain-containing protein [Ruegeria sp. HKCCD7319]
MSDPYSNLANEDDALQARIADAMDARCLEPAQVEIRKAYLRDLDLPEGAYAVEFGSGTGHVTNDLIEMAGATKALGIEPSPIMVERARQRFDGKPSLRFEVGDARNTGLPSSSVDLVLMHTLLCHVPDPQDAVREAHRILKPGGLVAVCDGDYDTATAQIADFDPLDQLVRFMINQNVTNLWVMRQIGELLGTAGFELGRRCGHGYVAEGEAGYFLTVIDRGADRMVETGVLFPQTAEALKAEARSRVSSNTFFGFMSYVSQIARKPIG